MRQCAVSQLISKERDGGSRLLENCPEDEGGEGEHHYGSDPFAVGVAPESKPENGCERQCHVTIPEPFELRIGVGKPGITKQSAGTEQDQPQLAPGTGDLPGRSMAYLRQTRPGPEIDDQTNRHAHTSSREAPMPAMQRIKAPGRQRVLESRALRQPPGNQRRAEGAEVDSHVKNCEASGRQ